MTLPLHFRGKDYPSIRAAALDHGLCVTSLWRAALSGQPENVGNLRKGTKPIPVTVNGLSYPSCTAAAAALGYDKTTMVSYVQRLGRNLRLAPKVKPAAVPPTQPGALNPPPAAGGL